MNSLNTVFTRWPRSLQAALNLSRLSFLTLIVWYTMFFLSQASMLALFFSDTTLSPPFCAIHYITRGVTLPSVQVAQIGTLQFCSFCRLDYHVVTCYHEIAIKRAEPETPDGRPGGRKGKGNAYYLGGFLREQK